MTVQLPSFTLFGRVTGRLLALQLIASVFCMQLYANGIDCSTLSSSDSSDRDAVVLCKHAAEWRSAIIDYDIAGFIRFESPDAQESVSYLIRDNTFGIYELIFGDEESYRSKLLGSINIHLIDANKIANIEVCYIGLTNSKSLCVFWFKLGPYVWYVGTDHVEPYDIG